MEIDRRWLLRLLGAGAALASPGGALAQRIAASGMFPPLTAAKDALQVMDFEDAARRALAPEQWGNLASGSDDDATLRANVEAYGHIGLKPHRLVDVSKTDLSVEIFGSRWETPLFLCPVGGQRGFYPQAEIATARAAKAKRHMMMLSNVSDTSLEDVAKTLGTPPWQQLYMPLKWAETEKLVRRIEDAGSPVLVWTVDVLGGRNMPTATRFARIDPHHCASCGPADSGSAKARPMYEGLEGRFNPSDATWATFDRLRKLTSMKIMIKGLDSADDAEQAVQHGADGVVVSNHGGRSMETLRATVDCLPEVVAAVRGRVPVFLDGGVRHGADIYKALALGASAVGIGRPYMWGLSAFGQDGVERVLEILRFELKLTMRQMGTPTIKDIDASRLVRV